MFRTGYPHIVHAIKFSHINCGAEGNRTPGLFHAMEALYQLSYSPLTTSSRYPITDFANTFND